ncbi:hypothetical protein B0A49_00835 [Cryomyces minteri]|uniref:FAD-binding domain-containing protein n=1 Tax=Cryomyces minteri TaxID=331657 RepID=A0A4U0XT81_9PEZI|nr:hypothetical protein B0A49_00835 [Cryomyces minteri]
MPGAFDPRAESLSGLDPICHVSSGLRYRTYPGEDIYTQYWDSEENFGKRFNGRRGEIHKILYQHALSLGIEIRLGQKVTDYFEDESSAGVVSNGERITGDVVLAADGVRSKARTTALGFEDKPKSSGYAVYRAWMMSDDLAKIPLTAELVVNEDTHTGWLGPHIHFLAASIKNGKEFSWDDRDVEESWSTPGDRADALNVLKGWDPAVHAIVLATPPEKLVDWKLVYRDPLPTWLSPKHRIALVGDAAHPFLPTSIQGASQAMEDGATIAVCLQLSGKEQAPLVLKAYQRIRYDRVRAAQKTGEMTRDKWHKTDFAKLKENPETVKLKREIWLLNHDAETHAYTVYEEIIEALEAEHD